SSVFLILSPPPGAPATFQATHCEPAIEDDSVTFAIPWHKRAADRVVEEPPPVVLDDDGAYRVAALTRGPSIDDAIKHLASDAHPLRLDAIEEAVRLEPDDLPSPAAIAQFKQMLEDVADKPVNGTAKTHVYADSEDVGPKHEFAHAGKSCLLNKRQH